MPKPIGTIFVELDLDATRYTKSQRTLLKDATSTSLSIEDNFRKLGIKSSAHFDLMRQKATNAFEMIKHSAQATSNDIIRAEKAKADQIIKINEQQFGKQTSMLNSLKSHWLAASAAMAVIAGTAVKAWDMAKAGAAYEEQRGMLDNLASKYRTTADTIVEQMDRASKFQIAKSELMQVALSGVAKGLKPEQLINLANAAETLGDAVGKDATTALKELTEALETGRTRGLRNYLGGTLDLKKVFGDLESKMTDAEKSQAMYNITMMAAIEIQNQQTKETDDAADKIAQIEKKFDDATLAASRFFKTVIVGFIDSFKNNDAYTEALDDLGMLSEKLNEIQGFMPGVAGAPYVRMPMPPRPGEGPKSINPYELEIERLKKLLAARKKVSEESTKINKQEEENLRALQKAYGDLAQTMADDMFPAQTSVNRMIEQGNKFHEEQIRLLEKTKDLVKEQGWEDYAEGIEGADEATRQLTRMTLENSESADKAFQKQASDYEHLMERIHDATADTFNSILSGQIRSFSDFLGSMKNMFMKWLSDIAAEAIKPIIVNIVGKFTNALGGGVSGLGSLIGGGGGAAAGGGSSMAGMGAVGAAPIAGYAAAVALLGYGTYSMIKSRQNTSSPWTVGNISPQTMRFGEQGALTTPNVGQSSSLFSGRGNLQGGYRSTSDFQAIYNSVAGSAYTESILKSLPTAIIQSTLTALTVIPRVHRSLT